MSAGELLDLHRTREIETGKAGAAKAIAEVRFEPRPVERLAHLARFSRF